MKHRHGVLFLFLTFLIVEFLIVHNSYALFNYAPLGIATSNGYYNSSTSPDHAIDEDDLTIWNAGDHGSSEEPNWLQVDLGTTRNINYISVFWGGQDGQYAGYTNIYRFYTGTTGSDWTLKTSGTFVDESPNPSDYSFLLDFGTAGLDMRYAKYEVTGGTHWSGVAEIRILGENDINPVPEPTSILLLGTGLVGLIGFTKKLNR
jgi:hypothetical protein